MNRLHLRRSRRSAFSLVELMVVILILAIVVSLVSAVAVRGMDKLKEVETRKEISEMEVGLRAFMSDFGLTDPPPSYLVLNEANPFMTALQDGGRSGALLEKMFGKNLRSTDWNGDGRKDGLFVLQGGECLVFYLGGIPNSAAVFGGAAPSPQGFAVNNMDPGMSVTQCPKRKGPYFNFATTRLFPQPQQTRPDWQGFFFYVDPWMAKSGILYQIGSPYVFFSSVAIRNQYDTTPEFSATPYLNGVGKYMNPNTYQIISAGRDGQFGGGLWNPSGGTTGPGADDQANFSATLLGAGQN